MAGRQRFFENGTDKQGNAVPADLAAVKAAADWAGFFVRVETGIFAFSDGPTAKTFAGDLAEVLTR